MSKKLSNFKKGNWLLVDAATPTLHLAIFKNGIKVAHKKSQDGGVLENLFPLVKEILENAQTSIFELSGMLLCTGPGSVLGIRISATFFRTLKALQPTSGLHCLTYNSLHIGALNVRNFYSEPFFIVSRARIGQYYSLKVEKDFSDIRFASQKVLTKAKYKIFSLPNKTLNSQDLHLEYFDYDPVKAFEQNSNANNSLEQNCSPDAFFMKS